MAERSKNPGHFFEIIENPRYIVSITLFLLKGGKKKIKWLTSL
jgi:hypothetical protein